MASSPDATKWRLRLNNLVQNKSRYSHTDVAWSNPQQIGPSNNCHWLVAVYIRGVEFGRGQERNVNLAREVAAYNAWRGLHHEMYGMYPDSAFVA
ncbi:hypothetical protein EUX98_g5515 [Antrodiella citrinella]|uniref:DRBM domain-containing protein n=1 Tax=Antrodiella citrinella TaxID=2447956 RepID=A0A4S4MR82_9APHY|nr:hypothetical protein EUX98_g5515 [Antrodiella citrinella]